MVTKPRPRKARPWPLLLVAVGALVGCQKHEASGTDAAPSKGAVKQAYEALEPRLDAITTKFAGLHGDVAALPADLPGLDEIRAKLLATEEVLGVTGGRVQWLSGELDAALQAGKSDQLRRVSKEITRTSDEMAQLDRAGLELTHQLLPFEHIIEPPAKSP